MKFQKISQFRPRIAITKNNNIGIISYLTIDNIIEYIPQALTPFIHRIIIMYNNFKNVILVLARKPEGIGAIGLRHFLQSSDLDRTHIFKECWFNCC
jgi:hypothetical protein